MTQSSFGTEKPLHRAAFYREKPLHIAACTHRGFYAKNVLHREAFTRSNFYTQTHLCIEDFKQRNLYTEQLSQTAAFTHRYPLHTKAFTANFYREELLHANTHRSFYTGKLLHKEVFTQSLQTACMSIPSLIYARQI